VVDYCAKKNLYVILDWHYVSDTGPKVAQTSAFWRAMAPRFAHDSHVLFELFNEPMNNAGSERQRWLSVKADMQTWRNIVRTYAADNLVLVGGARWCQILAPIAADPVVGSNIVYVSHYYPAHWPGDESLGRGLSPRGMGRSGGENFCAIFGFCATYGPRQASIASGVARAGGRNALRCGGECTRLRPCPKRAAAASQRSVVGWKIAVETKPISGRACLTKQSQLPPLGVGRGRPSCEEPRGNRAKQSQFPRERQVRQVLGGKEVMVNHTGLRLRQNKANFRRQADREIGVPGRAGSAKRSQFPSEAVGRGRPTYEEPRGNRAKPSQFPREQQKTQVRDDREVMVNHTGRWLRQNKANFHHHAGRVCPVVCD